MACNCLNKVAEARDKKLIALAAENAGLKSKLKKLAQWPDMQFYPTAWEFDKGDGCEAEALLHSETPATDSILNTVRADELEKFAAMLNLSADKKEAEGYAEIAVDRRDLAVHALMMAANLRAAKDGE